MAAPGINLLTKYKTADHTLFPLIDVVDQTVFLTSPQNFVVPQNNLFLWSLFGQNKISIRSKKISKEARSRAPPPD